MFLQYVVQINFNKKALLGGQEETVVWGRGGVFCCWLGGRGGWVVQSGEFQAVYVELVKLK